MQTVTLSLSLFILSLTLSPPLSLLSFSSLFLLSLSLIPISHHRISRPLSVFTGSLISVSHPYLSSPDLLCLSSLALLSLSLIPICHHRISSVFPHRLSYPCLSSLSVITGYPLSFLTGSLISVSLQFLSAL